MKPVINAQPSAADQHSVTFLFTDIEGSTKLWEQQPQAMQAALARHDALLRRAIEAHGGHVFKTVGDAFFAAFSSPGAALAAAIEAQHALQQGPEPLRVRMAVHTGAAQYRDADYFGPALNRVARLIGAGHGGQILLSAVTAQQLPPEILAEIELRSLGVHRLRDITTREAVFQLLAPGLPARFPPLNTLDVAFRRGVLRTAAVALAVIAAISSLTVMAVRQARRADRNARLAKQQRRRAEAQRYAAQTSLAQRELEAANRPRAEELLLLQRPAPGQDDLRGWEWRYLWRQLQQDDSRKTLVPGFGEVNGVRYSPDGQTLAVLTRGSVKLYDAASRREVAHLSTWEWGEKGSGGDFSPDGRLLAWPSGPTHMRLWDLRRKRQSSILTAHLGASGWIEKVVFSPDGRLLAASGPDGVVRLWDVATGQARAPIAAHTGAVDDLAFSPDGRRLATSSEDQSVALWDVATRREVTRLRRLGDVVGSLAFSPNGKILASGSVSSGAVSLWNVATGEMVATLRGSRTAWAVVAFSPDGRRLAAGGGDGVLRLWALATRREIASLVGHRKGITCVAFSPDGKTLVSGSGDGTVKLWNPAPRPPEVLQGAPARVMRVAVSQDGKLLASGDENGLITLWNVRRRRKIAALRGESAFCLGVGFSPDGRRLASSGEDKRIAVWEISPQRPVLTQSTRMEAGGYPIQFSPDGKLLALTGAQNEIHLRNIMANREDAALRVHPGRAGLLQDLSFSPDGKLLAAGYHDVSLREGIVRLWDVAQHRQIDPVLSGHNGWCGPITFSPDGRLLATTNGAEFVVCVWDVATHRRIQELTGNAHQINWMAFAPDGRTLGTGSSDGTVRFWSTASWSEVASMNDPRLDFGGAFHPDGIRLFTGDSDGGIRVWRAATLAEADVQSAVVWHEREADRTEKAKSWPEVVSHLDALIRAQPKQPEHFIKRGRALLQLGQWARAAADIARGLVLGSDDLGARVDLGRAQLAAGDTAAYREACARMLDRLDIYVSEDSRLLNDAAFLCVLTPHAVVDPTRPLRLAKQAHALNPEDAGIRTLLGATLYRAGRFSAAIEQLDRNAAHGSQGGTPEDWLFLAMVHHALGHSAPARRYLERAQRWLDGAAQSQPGAASTPPLGWERRLALQILRREAEALLTKPSTETERSSLPQNR